MSFNTFTNLCFFSCHPPDMLSVFCRAISYGNDMQGASWVHSAEGIQKLAVGDSGAKWYSNVLADVVFTFPRNSAGLASP